MKSRYGTQHRHLRAREAKRVERGECFCAAPRCKHPGGRYIVPGEEWDLGHHPFDPTVYLGPMHQACNRNTVLERMKRRPRVVRAAARAWL